MRIITFTAAVFFFTSPIYGESDTTYRGIKLPVAAHDIWVEDNTAFSVSGNGVIYELLFYITAEGCTDSVAITGPFDSAIVAPLWGVLKGMDFSPASRNEDFIPFILPAKLEIFKLGNAVRVRLRWPIRNDDGFNDREMLKRVQELNDFEFPSPDMVPPYYCRIEKAFAGDSLAFAVFRLILDSTAAIHDIQPVAGNHRHCADIISSTLLYGQYQPGIFKGRPILSELYLTIRFFQDISYPTDIWPPLSRGTTGSLFNQIRLEVNPYLPRLACPPIPRNLVDEHLTVREEVRSGDSLSMEVVINTRGQAIITRFINPIRADREAIIKAIIGQLEFRPAINLESRPVYFEGRATLHFNYSRRIRIDLDWLR